MIYLIGIDVKQFNKINFLSKLIKSYGTRVL